MKKRSCVLGVILLSLFLTGSAYAWGSGWGGGDTTTTMSASDSGGGWTNSGAGLKPMSSYSEVFNLSDNQITLLDSMKISLNTSLADDINVLTGFNSVAITDKTTGNELYRINAISAGELEQIGSAYTDNDIYCLSAAGHSDSVTWQSPAGSSASSGLDTTVRVLSKDRAMVDVTARSEEGENLCTISVSTHESGIENICFWGYDDSGESYIIGYLDVGSESGADLTACIAEDGKSVEIFNKDNPKSSLIASINTEISEEKVYAFLNVKENGAIRDDVKNAMFISVPVQTPLGRATAEIYEGAPFIDGAYVEFNDSGDVSSLIIYDTFLGNLQLIEP